MHFIENQLPQAAMVGGETDHLTRENLRLLAIFSYGGMREDNLQHTMPSRLRHTFTMEPKPPLPVVMVSG